jgi:hypothetical protein
MARILHIQLTVAALALIGSPMAGAAALTCSGTVNEVIAHADGGISIRAYWNSNRVQICNSVTAWKGVPTEACKRWHAAALLARTTQQTLDVYYGNTAAANCASMPANGAADAPSTLTNK